MVRAVFPGSFDPVTKGHMDLVMRATPLFDELILAILINKEKNALIPLEDRISLLKELTQNIPQIKIQTFDGLLVDYVKKSDIQVVVRGLRTAGDFDYELPQAQINHKLCPKVETLYLASMPEYTYISSSAVKELLYFGGSISEMVPASVAKYLEKHYENRMNETRKVW